MGDEVSKALEDGGFIINHVEPPKVFTSYYCSRTAKGGSEQQLLVTIIDNGPDADPNYRYMCNGTVMGKGAQGNPASSPESAVRLVMWHKLDE